MNDFPYPEIQPFERLQVSDGLMINSQRWRLAHEYHQHRQNVLYQSLFLPGIICGLGVAPIEAPQDLPAQFRDGRWVQIQPGLAIDLQGNFIVVPTPINFRIATIAYNGTIEMVYLVLSYVDPTKLRQTNSNEILVETFRINEKTDLPLSTDIEICRLAIAEGKLEIQKPVDVFAPKACQLDMRYRLAAQIRPQNSIRIACLQSQLGQSPPIQQSFHFLGRAMSSLAPSLSIIEPIANLDIHAELTIDHLSPYPLIYLTNDQATEINDSTELALREYIAKGGLILIEAAIHQTKLENLLEIQQELQTAHHNLLKNSQSNTQQADRALIQAELQSELEAIEIETNNTIQDLLNTFSSHIPIETPMQPFSDLAPDHPLRSQPFLFSHLSAIANSPMQILTNGSVIILLGELSRVWSGQSDLFLPRESIRNCQELGINILNYAAQRYGIYQSMQVNAQYQSKTPLPDESDQRRITNMVDKLVVDKLA
ncbi:DUF4159 domain-containing protein [Pseudanabaena sp. 'Roaring Creek']|uniref:DUF4159 domain-containing protein n=1 Tax=Pseudanabaena sp. 'Roaring Creek' TaxID=1681830 RepID=UPI0006D7B9F4|nr:DUF4159 domain-containing protein [Pseudanabaena sp. 'Roaring Creek']